MKKNEKEYSEEKLVEMCKRKKIKLSLYDTAIDLRKKLGI